MRAQFPAASSATADHASSRQPTRRGGWQGLLAGLLICAASTGGAAADVAASASVANSPSTPAPADDSANAAETSIALTPIALTPSALTSSTPAPITPPRNGSPAESDRLLLLALAAVVVMGYLIRRRTPA